jgi:hypothetical protein
VDSTLQINGLRNSFGSSLSDGYIFTSGSLAISRAPGETMSFSCETRKGGNTMKITGSRGSVILPLCHLVYGRCKLTEKE